MSAIRTIIAAALIGSPATAQTAPEVGDPGLTMIPPRCYDASRRLIPTQNITVYYNKIASFNMGNVRIRSELIRGIAHVSYDESDFVAVFDILNFVRYEASDARVYHGVLDGRPILIWEETVENVARRAGIVEYRERTLVPLCDGVIRVPGDERPIERQRRLTQGNPAQ